MALIAPFRGLRYNTARISRLEDVVTPPYDVIDLKAQGDFLARNPYNMIKLDLSKNVTAEEMIDERYGESLRLLDRWQAESILVRDEQPVIYLYYIEYNHPSGRKLTRKGFVCLTGLAEFSEGIVKPHEKIFRGVVTDRLRLLDTCRTQFSQVFSIYADERGEVIEILEAARDPEPLCSCEDQDGCRHVIWPVRDSRAISGAREIFAGKSVYIADGHHRYNTALQMRELMAERHGRVAADSPFNFMMMYLCAMEDPGLSVLPTHRMVRMGTVPADSVVEKLAPSFMVEEVTGGSREALISEVMARMEESRSAANSFGFYHPGEDRCFLLVLKEGAMESAGLGGLPEQLRELDVVVLSDLILEKSLGLGPEKCAEENLIDYFSDPDEALDKAVKESAELEGDTVLFMMNNTEVYQVKNVSDAELVMPHKSTYFYPKILTGLVMNRMIEGEKVEV